ncbi:flagellar M-ring protein FliF [Chitinivorax tropicus]|uniref:Flagellar M-ring protein n=1 Tax=Chitinivorax tropicus TaxID=714531 RepID=A0A840MU33_9PROT|nr:flagellar basal-body MS-ring/collar protein FliF [Chitinivorax tropicus]MBB5019876.1 flagellar M-ring protein FliF [Chitinivorax tropicus]
MPEALRQILENIRQRFSSLPNNQKIAVIVGLATVVAMIVATLLWTQSTPYKVLFSNVSDRDGGAITQSLQQLNIPYKIEAGGTISVPAEAVYDTRLKLAAQGLPKGGTVGFELMDNQKLGVSQFAEQINYQRSIEGELARSIETLSSVQTARVHLAIPRQTVFLREQQKPSASVLVTLHPGRVLDGAQVAAIVHLIASSVPDMPVKSVTVVDQNGDLLSKSLDGISSTGLDPRQLNFVRQVERDYVKRIETILEQIVGKGNVKAEVTADLDFAETEQTSETFRPNSPPEKSAIRSQQSVETVNGAAANPSGIPGAFSNQPPGNATAPITTQPGQGTGGAGAATGQGTTHRESTINYEVDKTVQHVKQSLGNIKRLSAAVVVNYKGEKDKEGKLLFKARPANEMTQITNLVREAMGYSQQRGDSVNVVNAPFADANVEPPSMVERLTQEARANWQQIFKNALIALVVLYLIFGVIRPAIKYMTREPEPEKSEPQYAPGSPEEAAAQEAQALAEQGDVEQAERLATYADNLQMAKDLSKNDPRMVASVVRTWVMAEDE